MSDATALNRIGSFGLDLSNEAFVIVIENSEREFFFTHFPESSLPKLDLDDYGNDPCCVAQAIRRHLRLPRGPIDNLVNVLEDAGIIIILADFGTQLIDGFALLTNGAPPLIFVNSNMPMDRIRYSLCHELGHIILHTIPHPNIEKEANLFAAEFLAPAEEIGPYLDNMSLDTVASLKPYWKMAMSALIVRAKHLGKLDDNQYRYLWMKMNSLGFMRREPVQLDLPYEEPTLLQEILDTHLNELNYTVPEMCKMLMIYEDDFRRWYLPNKKENHLKMVK